jgi:hypothetical protein
MNEDRCPSCQRWVKWDRNKVGDFTFHTCASGVRWVMSVHGAPVRLGEERGRG